MIEPLVTCVTQLAVRLRQAIKADGLRAKRHSQDDQQ